MKVYCRNKNIIDGSIDDNQVMMHIEKGKYFGLNPVGKRIWELIEKPKSLEEIVGQLTEEYNVPEGQCAKEVVTFLEMAIRHDIVKIDE
ncbi:MAG: PqqD family protein [Rikenellaceae bacterium]|nr:PqqD family protein [Rikenellaceae bacterium]